MKKFLALLLAIMMVVALVPATVLSVMASELASLADDGDDSNDQTPVDPDEGASAGDFILRGEETVDERPTVPEKTDEEIEAEGLGFVVLNAAGAPIGYYTTLAAADAAVRDGDTLKFLADLTLTATYTFAASRADAVGSFLRYTVDGNGKTVHYNGNDTYALVFDPNSQNHDVTIVGLTVISNKACLQLNAGTGNGFHFTLENMKLYGNYSYSLVDADYYTEEFTPGTSTVLQVNTVNSYVDIKGADTVFYGYNGSCINANAVMAIHDGYFYSAEADCTINCRNANASTTRTEHKLLVYGGTFVSGGFAALRVTNGATLYLFNGTVVQADGYKDAWAAPIRVGSANDSNNACQAYILGGDIYMGQDSSLQQYALFAMESWRNYYIANVNIHYNNEGKAYGNQVHGKDSFQLSRFSTETTTAVTENNSMELLNYASDTGKITVTWQYETVIAYNSAKYGASIAADGSILAPDGTKLFDDDAAMRAYTLAQTGYAAEAALIDADGNILDLIDIDNDTAAVTCIHYNGGGADLSGVAYTTLRHKLWISTLLTPHNGTFRLLTDILQEEDGEDINLFGLTGRINVTLDGGGHSLVYANDARYLSYSTGGAYVTLKNIYMYNPLGRGIEIGNTGPRLTDTGTSSARYMRAMWTVGEGATVSSYNGSPFVINDYATLNVLEGATILVNEESPYSAFIFQIHEGSTLNVLGGIVRSHVSAAGGSAALILDKDAKNVVINFQAGDIYLPSGVFNSLYFREAAGSDALIKVGADAHFYTPGGELMTYVPADAEVEVYNADGALKGSYATLAEAVANVDEGGTVRLLGSTAVADTIVMSGNWTLDGNGQTIFYMSGTTQETTRTYNPALHITGEGSDVTVKDLTIYSPTMGIVVSPFALADLETKATDEATLATDARKVAATLDNCVVYAQNTSHNGDYWVTVTTGNNGKGQALFLFGTNTFVTVKGEDGIYCSSSHTAVVNLGGYLDIYDGYFYTYSGNDTLLVRGRTDLTASTSNMMVTATTAIYGGQFVAGPMVKQGVARAIGGGNLVIVDGEFYVTEGATEERQNGEDRSVIRASASNVSGYVYILGGRFYSESNTSVLGFGNVDVGYFRIWGGQFYSRFYESEEEAIANGSNIHNKYPICDRSSLYSFNRNTGGATEYYGMQIDDAYSVEVTAYATAVYPASTKIAAISEGNGFLYLQEIKYNESWLERNGYLNEGAAYRVTTGDDGDAPAYYYGFELERAMYHVGNGGAITLLQNVNYKQPVKSGSADYGVQFRYRPDQSVVIMDSAVEQGYYTITATANNYLIYTAGGAYIFNIGLVNNEGGCLRANYGYMDIGTDATNLVISTISSTYITILDGCFLANQAKVDNTDDAIYVNVANVYLTIERGYLSAYKKAAISITGNSVGGSLTLGIEGTKIGPEIVLDGAQGIYFGGLMDRFIVHYVRFDDIGTAGEAVKITSNGVLADVYVYDGYFYVNSKGNHCVFATDNNATVEEAGTAGTVNIYGGEFVRGATGTGSSTYGKVLIFNGPQNVNILGGTFRTETDTNVVMTVRRSLNVTVTIGAEGTEGPTFISRGGYTISVDNMSADDLASYGPTGVVINIYSGSFRTAGSTGLITLPTTAELSAELNIWGGTFEFYGAEGKPMIWAGNNDPINIYGGEFISSGIFLYSNTADAIHDVKIEGGNFIIQKAVFQFQNTGTLNMVMGKKLPDGSSSGPSIEIKNGSMFLTGTNALDAHFTFWGGSYVVSGGSGNLFAIYNNTGSINIYDGNFEKYGTSRLMRIAGDQIINIVGGTFHSEAADVIALADDSNAILTIGTKGSKVGPIMTSTKESILTLDTTKGPEAYIYGGSFTCTGTTDHALILNKATSDAKTEIWGGDWMHTGANKYVLNVASGYKGSLTVHDGSFVAAGSKGYPFYQNGADATTVINGGSFDAQGNADSCINVAGGSVIINAGTFTGNGMSVARAYGGVCSSWSAALDAFEITTESTAQLTINGGLFILYANADRNPNDCWNGDAVLRAGGGTSYGTITLNGGTFINQSAVSARVVNKINPCSTVIINGGRFMMNTDEVVITETDAGTGEISEVVVLKYYFFSNGEAHNAAGDQLCGADPDNIAVNADDAVVVWADRSYTFIVISDDNATNVGGATGKAALRMEETADGIYTGGLRFTSSIDADTIAAFRTYLDDLGITEATLSYGTLIVPADYLKVTVARSTETTIPFTHADLIEAGRLYLDIAAVNSLEGDEANGVSFNAVIANILESNYDRAFVAIGYVMAVDADGVAHYAYATEYDEDGISLAEAAKLALESDEADSLDATLKAALEELADLYVEPEIEPTPDVPGDSGNDGDDDDEGDEDGDGDGDGGIDVDPDDGNDGDEDDDIAGDDF